MMVRELGYVVIGAQRVADWRPFAEEVLGMATAIGPGDSLYLKMDERDFRLAVVPCERDCLIASGWAVPSSEAYVDLKKSLGERGVAMTDGSGEERQLRRVQDFFWFLDPAGNRVEIFWGPICEFRQFISPIGVPGFVTGELGLGHVVLPALDVETCYRFWHENLGFGLSDILAMDFGGQSVKLRFMHCGNKRQHSLALAGMPSPAGLIHMCVELPSLKDVGLALDRVMRSKVQLVMTLGQHVNDDAVSFYFMAPGGAFFFEIGWQGVLKDWDRHTVFETTLPSYWGHQFVLNDPRYRVET